MNFSLRFLLFFIGISFSTLLFSKGSGHVIYAQDTLQNTLTDSTKENNISYWERDAYKNFQKDTIALKDSSVTKEYKDLSKKYTGNEFNYQENKRDRLSLLEKISRRINQFFDDFFPDWSRSTSTAMIYLLVLLGIAALIFIIYKVVFSGNKVWAKEKKEDTESEVLYLEKNLENIDIAQYIQKAIEAKNFELAIRYLHLENLQALAKKGFITWDYRKTNADFLQEMKQEDLKQQFSKTTLLFNYIWFGKFEIDAEKFEEYKQDFINFKNKISR